VETPDLYDGLKRGVLEEPAPSGDIEGFQTGEVMKYVTASWKIGSAYCFYVLMNKNKWNSLPADVQKTIMEFSKEFNEQWAVEWNKIDIEGKEFFTKLGGQIMPLPRTRMRNGLRPWTPL